MFQLNYRYFSVYWNRYRPVELKYIEVTSLQKMSATMVIWLRKIVSWNCLQWLEILLTFEIHLTSWHTLNNLTFERKFIRFHYKLGFLMNCLKLTSLFELSSSLRDLEFRCGFYFLNHESWCSDNFSYFQGKSNVEFSLAIIIQFSLKSNWI